ncbi:uncharacterized protein LOC125499462 [Beta vulgaris subsp. vulgaris]|uniref:uncharacterized protein LOC125499462 n=1 Tax=Beta vulgaris subsp. vulgaris TaxID=3555 RepID=UPI0025466EFE|nr:uncharacterized protein LOC125499462 [Beta vulgaris subsp. vulgaris]
MVKDHLLTYGIIEGYTFWYHHGERVGEDTFESQSSEEVGDDELLDDDNENEMDTILRDFFPNCSGFAENDSFSELRAEDPNDDAKKFFRFLMICKSHYLKIDACVNDCMLFWKDDEQLEYCKICNASRWKQGKNSGEIRTKENGKRIPEKVLRYFPLKPRLQRLFMCSKTAHHMRWHHERLGLISDGFNPFSNVAKPYSIWPVMLVPYNLPPSMCMKPSSMLLSMLIPGPKGPGDAIDVYLQPLIEELKELWEVGVETYDASKKENFKMHAALLLTINDFPAYGMLSGWSTKGKRACPCCHKETSYMWLPNCFKHVYMRHRRFLPINHPWRRKKDVFGKKEKGEAPKPLSGEEVLEQVRDLEGICLSKDPSKKTKVSHKIRGDNWNKKRQTKDTANSRFDMEGLGIMPKLHPISKGDKIELPPAPYTLSKSQKEILCRFLKELKVPDGYSSNISRCVNVKDCKISGLKSHDCHVLLQSILPLVIRGLLVKDVSEPLVELCQFFGVLCARSVQVEHLEKIKSQIPLTLSKLEAWLPPSCFDVMLHLSVHLADELILGGPVHFRWMYPGERYLHKLKLYVRNKARPEGSIAEGYIVDECMTLCSRYLDDVETKFNRHERNCDGDDDTARKLSIFSHPGRPLGGGKTNNLDVYEREQAHIYALKNCIEVDPFYKEYAEMIAHEGVELSQHQRDVNFASWFRKKVSYITRDRNLRTQNSGVVVLGDTGEEKEALDFYGALTEVIRVEYLGGNYVVFFRCDWYDVLDSKKGINVDKFGYVSVDTQRNLKTDEPFVLASQVSQVFYATDIVKKGNWRVAVKTKPRVTYELAVEKDNDSQSMEILDDAEDAYQERESFGFVASVSAYTHNEMNDEHRVDMEPDIVENVDAVVVKKRKRKT